MANVNIRYIVDDVESAIEFYSSLLGFKVKMHPPSSGFAALENDGLYLFLNQPGAGSAGKAMQDGQVPEPGGWNRIQLKVDDLESIYKELKNNGASFRNSITEGKGGRQVLLEDPSGNMVELFEPANQPVQPVPEGYHTITPFLLARNAPGLIDFIKKAFSGKVTFMMKSDDDKIRHSTVKIGDSLVMISSGIQSSEPMPCMLHVYVEDVDSVYKQALEAGGTSLREPEDQFYGDRSAGIEDEWKNQWWIATHIKDISDDEMKNRETGFRE